MKLFKSYDLKHIYLIFLNKIDSEGNSVFRVEGENVGERTIEVEK